MLSVLIILFAFILKSYMFGEKETSWREFLLWLIFGLWFAAIVDFLGSHILIIFPILVILGSPIIILLIIKKIKEEYWDKNKPEK